jgi:hypothetical protein
MWIFQLYHVELANAYRSFCNAERLQSIFRKGKKSCRLICSQQKYKFRPLVPPPIFTRLYPLLRVSRHQKFVMTQFKFRRKAYVNHQAMIRRSSLLLAFAFTELTNINSTTYSWIKSSLYTQALRFRSWSATHKPFFQLDLFILNPVRMHISQCCKSVSAIFHQCFYYMFIVKLYVTYAYIHLLLSRWIY